MFSSPPLSKQGRSLAKASEKSSGKKKNQSKSLQLSPFGIQKATKNQDEIRSHQDILDDLLNTQAKRLQIKKRNIKQIAKSASKTLQNKKSKVSKQLKFKQEESEMDCSFSNDNDNEASILMKRVRKNRDQIKSLNKAYQMAQGNWTKDDQKMIAHELGLSEQQVYKWSWDQLQKRKRVSQQQQQESKTSQCTDEFGGYSKSWFLKNMSKFTTNENSYSDDMDGIDSISTLVGLDIEKLAKDVISVKSPEGQSKRQITKPVNAVNFSIIGQKNVQKLGCSANQSLLQSQLLSGKDLCKQALHIIGFANKMNHNQPEMITPKFPHINQQHLIKGMQDSPMSTPHMIKQFSFEDEEKVQFMKSIDQLPNINLKLFHQNSNENNKLIKSAAMKLFQDLPDNENDDPLQDDKHMLLELQRQNSNRMNNQQYSPLYYLMPLNQAQSDIQQSSSQQSHQHNQQKPMVNQNNQINLLNSAWSSKMVLFSPSPNIQKELFLP